MKGGGQYLLPVHLCPGRKRSALPSSRAALLVKVRASIPLGRCPAFPGAARRSWPSGSGSFPYPDQPGSKRPGRRTFRTAAFPAPGSVPSSRAPGTWGDACFAACGFFFPQNRVLGTARVFPALGLFSDLRGDVSVSATFLSGLGPSPRISASGLRPFPLRMASFSSSGKQTDLSVLAVKSRFDTLKISLMHLLDGPAGAGAPRPSQSHPGRPGSGYAVPAPKRSQWLYCQRTQ